MSKLTNSAGDQEIIFPTVYLTPCDKGPSSSVIQSCYSKLFTNVKATVYLGTFKTWGMVSYPSHWPSQFTLSLKPSPLLYDYNRLGKSRKDGSERYKKDIIQMCVEHRMMLVNWTQMLSTKLSKYFYPLDLVTKSHFGFIYFCLTNL